MMEEIIQAIKQTKNEIGNKEVECEWREFLLSEIFDIQHGNNFDKNKMTFNNPKINFISRTRENNGFLCKVDLINGIQPYENGLITMSLIGEGRGACFVQKEPFYTTQNMLVLNPKSNLITDNVKLFLIQRITYTARNIYDAYTNTLHGNIDKFLFKLPSKNNQPDFEMMEKIIVDLKKQSKLDKINKLKEKLQKDIRQLDTSNWEQKTIDELFYISGSKTTAKLKLKKIGFGEYPYITTKATNNGCDGYYNFYTEKGNCLTIDSAVSGSCFYQEKNFSASDHVEVLRPKDNRWNKNVLLFIKTLIDIKIRNQFNYSIKCNQKQIAKITIKLPSFEFMEKFIEEIKL